MSGMDTSALPVPAATRRTTPRDFLTVVFRHRWVVITLPVVALVVAASITLSEPPRFSSSSRLLLKRGSPESGLEPHVTVLPREEELASQVEIAKSVAVLRRAQQILNQEPGRRVRLDPAGASAAVVGESNVVDITYESTDAGACAPAADALTQAFMEYHRRAFSIPNMAAFFTHQTDSLYAQLQNLRRMKEELLAGQNSVEPEETRRNVMQLLLSQQTALADVRVKRVAMETELKAQQELFKDPSVDLPFMPSVAAGDANLVVDMQKTLEERRVKLEELRGKYSETHPSVLAIRDQIAQVEQQVRRQSHNHLLLEQQGLEVVRAQERQLQSAVTALQQQLTSYPAAQVRLEELENMIQITDELYKETRERQAQALMAGAASPDWTASLLVPAGPPMRLNKYDYVRIALAPLLSLAAGIGLAFLLDSLDHSLKGVRDVEDILGLPVLASVREIK
ncbi:MAG TPA: hypothetical protein VMS93_01580 [Candidatus Saccharimonadales bacterium]|nr:hypothetical protein [Candidatus Saccharimonadales bacterium]